LQGLPIVPRVIVSIVVTVAAMLGFVLVMVALWLAVVLLLETLG
jgi:hypothetical protein